MVTSLFACPKRQHLAHFLPQKSLEAFARHFRHLHDLDEVSTITTARVSFEWCCLLIISPCTLRKCSRSLSSRRKGADARSYWIGTRERRVARSGIQTST